MTGICEALIATLMKREFFTLVVVIYLAKKA